MWRLGKAKFQCEHCDLQLTRNWRKIARHYRRQHLWGNFFCKLCNFFAYYPIEYASHMLDRHLDMQGGVTAQCAECGQEIHLNGNVNTLAEHYKDCAVAVEDQIRRLRVERKKKVMKDTLINDVRTLCPLCGKEVKKKYMNIHMYEHRRAELLECDPSGCNAMFATPEEKKNHMKTAHKRYREVACDKCGKMFQAPGQLRDHIQFFHEKKSLDVKCTECDMVFTSAQNRNRHRILVHYPDKYKCKTCQRSFSTPKLLQRHELVHSGRWDFSCDECDRQFTSKTNFDEHKRVLAGVKSFACKHCSYTSTTSSLLYHHRRRRHLAEFEEERREKERAKVKVSKDVLVGMNVETGT